MRRSTVRALSAIHAAAYRLTGGRVGGRLVRNDMLLLTTTGRRSGKPHTTPLLYLTDYGSLVVIASYGGHDRHPDWYCNLIARPRARVQLRSRRIPVIARVADPAHRAVLWPLVVEAYPGYEAYQARTERVIPVVLLDRTD